MRRSRGFTLIELLMVIVIIGILVSVLIPRFANSREKAFVTAMKSDLRNVPHVFVHWPSEMATKHHAAGAEVMKAIIDAQMTALKNGDLPTLGDNAKADPTLQGGAFF